MQTPKCAFAAAPNVRSLPLWPSFTSWKAPRLFHVLASRSALRWSSMESIYTSCVRRVQIHTADEHVLQCSVASAAAGDEDAYVLDHCSALEPQGNAWGDNAWRVVAKFGTVSLRSCRPKLSSSLDQPSLCCGPAAMIYNLLCNRPDQTYE